MKKFNVFFAVTALLSFASACSSADHSTDSRDLALIESCAGSYHCVDDSTSQASLLGSSFEVELGLENGTCNVSSAVNLLANGDAVTTGSTNIGKWTGDRETFSICNPDDARGCIHCTLQNNDSAPNASAH